MSEVSINGEQILKSEKELTIEDILSLDLTKSYGGRTKDKIVVTFKKTKQITQYEPETIEVTVESEFEGGLSEADRLINIAILQVQTEYAGLVNLRIKGLITDDFFIERRDSLEGIVNSIKRKVNNI